MKIPRELIKLIQKKKKKSGGKGDLIALSTRDFDPEITGAGLDRIRGMLHMGGVTQTMPSWLGKDTITFKLSQRGKNLVDKGRF